VLREVDGPDDLDSPDRASLVLPARRVPAPAWPGQLVDLSNRQLFVRVALAGSGGAGPPPDRLPAEPVVLVHGLGGSSTNWTDLMGDLSQPDDRLPALPLLDCSAVDLPGFGFSPPPSDLDYTISGHARAVIDLIEKQGNWPVHLIGNSMGGAVITRVAARRPDLVRTLVLISPALPDVRPRPLPARLSLVTVPGVGKAIMNWLGRQPADMRADMSIRDVFKDPRAVHPDRREAEIAELIRRDSLVYAHQALILSARSLFVENFKAGRTSLWRDAARTRAPALVLHGSHDKLVNPVMAAKAARAFRGARVLVLPRVGHVAMMEKPEVVADEIRSFLAGARAARVAVLSP
jgi:pimeloyl-ACP methyl ester carboxylesterase